MVRCILSVALSGALAVTPVALAAAQDCATDAMLVFDGSGSMAEMGFNLLDQPRIFEAREAVARAMPFVAPVRRLGLIVYGPGATDDCTGIDLRFAPMVDAGARVVSEIDVLEPTGKTPLTVSVEEAANVLEYKTRPGLIVLVTDGKETCGGAPCQLAATFAANAVDLTVHVIGFRVRSEHFGWQQGDARTAAVPAVAQCLADVTGGTYVPAESVEDLASALEETLGCPLIGRALPSVGASLRHRG